MEAERDRGLAAANEMAALDRARPLSLRDMLEKEGCRPTEKLRTDKLDDMTSVDKRDFWWISITNRLRVSSEFIAYM